MSASEYRLSIDQIRAFLPHRQPFLLVDRILEIHPKGDLNDLQPGSSKVGSTVVGIKNISYGESCFAGHFPEFSIYPGVWIIETMAQVSAFSMYPYMATEANGRPLLDFECILVGVDGARFRRPVVPGDTMKIDAKVAKCRGKLWVFEVSATVDGEKVAEAELLANFTIKETRRK